MGRRSVWAGQSPEAPSLQDRESGGVEKAPKTVLEMLKAPEKKRDARQREKVITFYGIPEVVHERVKSVAEELGVPAGDVARLFFERGLDALDSGTIRLDGQLSGGRRTLFPTTWGAQPVGKPQKRRKKEEPGKVSYRGLPEGLVTRMSTTSEKAKLPAGETARWLLEWGLGEYDAGRLEVEVYAVEAKYSLYGSN